MNLTLFTLLVCAGGLLASRSGALTLQLLWCLFGAAAAIALPALGGATVTPAVLFLPFLLVRAIGERGVNGCLRQIAYPAAGFWLTLLVIWGVLSAYFLPRIFAGEVMIQALDRAAFNLGIALVPLHPVSTNLTQSGYALGGVCAFVAVRTLLERRGVLDHLRDAVLLLAGLNCLAALINLGEFYLGLPGLLEYVRTGGYAMFDNYEVAGLMRIQGTFSETSAFSGFTLPLFAFTFSLWLYKVRTAYSGVLALSSLVFLLISTSGTAYIGLAFYLSCLALGLAWRGIVFGRVPRLGALLLMGMLAPLITCGVFIFEPELAERVADVFEITVLNKMQSSSGVERSSWNQQAWSNFLDTYGVGVGLGSARASSYPLVLLSNVGVIGTLFFLVFLIRLFRSNTLHHASPDRAAVRASKQAIFAALISASFSGAVFDLSVLFYVFAAVAVAPPVSTPATGRTHAYA
jgi:hypothetical protein